MPCEGGSGSTEGGGGGGLFKPSADRVLSTRLLMPVCNSLLKKRKMLKKMRKHRKKMPPIRPHDVVELFATLVFT
jgi:hypothetical protein